MKTLVIISNQAFSLVNFRGHLIRLLAKSGIRVYALAPDYDAALKLQVTALGAQPIEYRLARAGMNPWNDFWNMVNLTIILRKLQPDASLAYTVKPVIYGTLAAWIARVPRRLTMIEGLGYVFTPAGEHLTWLRRLLRSAVVLLYRAALSKSDCIIFLNQDDIEEFVGRSMVERQKVALLGGIGVDLEEWAQSRSVVKPTTFLLAARLLREKGIVEFVEAARQVKAAYPEVRFVLLGALDPNPGNLSAIEVQSWVHSGLIEWPGHVAVKPWLIQTSVYVLPSYREGVPRSTQEAMAMGRAIVTTNAPGCRDTVVDGINGYLVPVRDVPALVQAMTRFIENPDLIERMGQESRKLAEERFDVNKINLRLVKILIGEK